MGAVVVGDGRAAPEVGVDAWLPYFELRRNALRELASHTDLAFFSRPALFGALPRTGSAVGGGLWVTGPEALEPLPATLTRASPDWVTVAEAALAVLPVVHDRGWTASRTFRAMALTRLRDLPTTERPAGVVLQRVDLNDGGEGVSLEEALLVDVLHGDSNALSATRDLPDEVVVLRTLRGISLYAAVDASGNCVGVAGCRVIGRSALICAVATIPAFRRRGIASALTAAAVDGARLSGATRAFLDASAGEGMYARLGFTALGTVVRCERPGTGAAAL